MADQLQLPPGYEDAKPIQAQAENLQLPPGYEDARPVSAPSPEREALILPEAANLPKASGSSYEMRPTLPSGERVGKMEADETAKKPTLGGTASGLWEAANTPIVPEGRMEKTANEYATEQERLQHPYRAAAARSVADVGKTARQLLTSPLAVGTVGVGPALEEAGGAVKAGAKLLPLAFGAAGGQQAVQGVESMKKEGVNPENLQQTLEGASQAALGGAGTVEGTHAGEAPLKETVTAPVRAASRILRPVAPVLPYVAGETAAGFPGYIAAKVIAPKEWISRTLEKGTVVGLPEEEANARKLEYRAKDLEKKAAATKADVDMHKASSAQGIEVPEQFVKAHAKAQGLADEARMHADIAREAADKAGAVSKENPQQEQPVTADHTAGLQGDIDRMAPKPKVSAPKVPAPKGINVKGPGEIQRETIEQPLTEMPTNPRVGQETLANRQGRMGRTFALPEAPLDLGAGEVLSPEKAPEVPAAEKKPATIEGGLAPLPPDETIKPRPIKKDVEKVGELVNQGLGNEPVKPGVPLKEQTSKFGKPIRSEIEPEAPKANEPTKEPEKLSSDPRKAVLQQAGASPEAIEKILSRGTKTDPTSKVGLSKLAEAFGVDLGQTAIGRAKGDVAAGTHMAPADVLKKIIDAGHSPEEIAKAIDEGKHLPTVAGGSPESDTEKATGFSQKADKRYPAENQEAHEALNERLSEFNKTQSKTSEEDNKHMEQAKKELGPNAFPSDYLKRAQELKDAASKPVDVAKSADDYNKDRLASDIGEWKAPPELGAMSAEDVGAKVRTKNPEPAGRRTGGELPEGQEEKRSGADRRAQFRESQSAEDKLFKQARQELGEDATTDEIEKRIGEIKDRPKPSSENTKLSDEELLKKGFTQDDLDNGRHLPTVSGAKGKELPTGDELIKKYGESSGDPAHTTFILKDGRGVANTGIDHDIMLGGKATDKKPPREQFVAQGNIRIRPRMGTIGGREVGMSIPESGINDKQLAYINKMGPQLRSGAVLIEIGKPGGDYRILSHGEATEENLHKALSDLAPIKNANGSPVDQFGNPTVSGGSQADTAPAKEGKLPKVAEEHITPEEKAGVTKSEAGRKSFVDHLKALPSVQEFTDIAKAGEGGKDWYSRSAKAFDALHEEAPKYFQEGDRQKFTDFVAALSPQQTVTMNLKEALNAWTKYVDEGRPTGKPLEKLLNDELTLPGAKIPNATKALAGEPLWPDLSKNSNFKVPSFAKNLQGYLNHVTNDGWQGLFGGLDAKSLSKPTSYHPLSVITRAAADALGWEPAEAQAAIWAFTKTFTEKGETDPKIIRRYSEDFADIMAHDPEVRQLLAQLGVDNDKLDSKLRAIGKKPEITPGASPTTENSVRKLSKRIEEARGKRNNPSPKVRTP